MVQETVLFRKCSFELPLGSVYEITHCFAKRYRGASRAPESWRILRVIFFFERPDGRPEQGKRGFKAIVSLSVMSKWHTAVAMELLAQDGEPRARRRLNMEAEERE